MFNLTVIKSHLRWSNLSTDEQIFVYVSTPLSLLGFLLCLFCGLLLSNSKFKQKSVIYIKIMCFLMAVALLILAFRSISPLFWSFYPLLDYSDQNVLIRMVKLYVFSYLLSPIEASILVSIIMACLNQLVRYKPNKRGGPLERLVNLNPNRVMSATFMIMAALFSYQLLVDPTLFYIEFVHKNFFALSIMTFSIRDGILLAVLIVLASKIWSKIRKSMQRKANILDVRIRRRVNKAKRRINIIILVVCSTIVIGRLPFLLFVLIHIVYPNLFIPGLLSLCITSAQLSYSSTFFIFFISNKQFRNELFKKLFSRKPTRV